MSIPVTIVAGFLGAGKTTLVKRLLADAPERIAVLVNDFAAINIDAALIESSAPGRIALTNGCVCCTLRDDLLAGALELASIEPKPERIVVETSGVAEPYGVMEAFFSPLAAGRVHVESTVCVVDAEQFPALDYASGERAIDQAAVSDIVLLNKCDLVDDDALRSVEQTLYGAQPSMRIVRTMQAQLPWAVLLGISDRDRESGRSAANVAPHAHGAQPSPEICPEIVDARSATSAAGAAPMKGQFASLSWRSSRPLDLDAFQRFVAALPRSVLRAKGIVRFAEHPRERAIFQLVGKRSSLTFEAEPGAMEESRLVCIGAATSFDPDSLARLFAALERDHTTEGA